MVLVGEHPQPCPPLQPVTAISHEEARAAAAYKVELKRIVAMPGNRKLAKCIVGDGAWDGLIAGG